MSGGKVLKSSPKSPSTIKHHGPMKATLPMASLLKQSSPLRTSVSPTFSPWKPAEVHSGLRSPGSTINKVKVRADKSEALNCIRRSASLDAIYLQGQWPRENLYVPQLLQVDKATQTDEHEWMEYRKILVSAGGDESNNSTNGNDKLDKYLIRHKLQRIGNNSQGLAGGRSQTSPTGGGFAPVIGDHTLNTSSQTNTSCLIPRALPVNIPIKPLAKPTMRNSVEGLNQEIERLVLKSDALSASACDKTDDFDKVTPEGHRAPFPDLYRSTRSVNTQTPSANDLRGSCHSSNNMLLGPPSRDSVSPLMIPGQLDTSPSDAGGSHGSSPDQEYSSTKLGTSPRIFLARGPPDGCERVCLRMESSTLLLPTEYGLRMPQPCTAFRLQPSQGSAFQLLQPAAATMQREHTPIVPTDQDLI